MGGRLALEAMLYYDAPFLSLTCLSTSLTVLDRKKRIKQEQAWIQKLEESTIEEFIDYWYRQKIFSGFLWPSRRYIQNKEGLLHCLNEFSILKSPPLTNKILSTNKKIQFLYRDNDPKANPIKNFKNLHYIKSNSHCIHLENKEACITHIHNFL